MVSRLLHGSPAFGQRMLLCVQSIASGQQLLAVPLRLALKDYADDPEAAAHCLADAPWAVRLAAKLLRELQLGPASQWAPYLQVSTHSCSSARFLPTDVLHMHVA